MIYSVIGLGFGDEGKGVVTNFLSSKNSLVIRYTGGQNAGHTVYHNNIKHIFSNFGSGTIKEIPTYWTKYCTIDIEGILNEYAVLKDKNIFPKIFIDSECPLTTPFEKYSNITDLTYVQNGTVGVGVGKTLERESKFYSLKFGDIFYPEIFRIKISLLSNFYNFSDKIEYELNQFFENVEKFKKLKFFTVIENDSKSFGEYEKLIFEGSQGLMLDQYIGFFPHVTRFNIRLNEYDVILKDIRKKIDIWDEDFCIKTNYFVTRAYQTRHGNGPMLNEHFDNDIIKDPNETNVQNKHQGKFRISWLNVDLLTYALDKSNLSKDVLVITCLEHMNSYKFVKNNKLISFNNEEEFVNEIFKISKCKKLLLCKNYEFYKIEN